MAVVLVLYLTLGLELQLSIELRASSFGLHPWNLLVVLARVKTNFYLHVWQIFNDVKDRGVSRADYLSMDQISP